MTLKTPASEPDQHCNGCGTQPLQIYGLMPKLIGELGVIPKGQWNQELRYNFRGIDDAQRALSPALAKLGISLQIEIREHKLTVAEEETRKGKRQVSRATLTMRVWFCAPDGSAIYSDAVGEAMDYGGDKTSSKAMSTAWKYAIFQALSASAQGMEDNDQHTPLAERATQPRWMEMTSTERRDWSVVRLDNALEKQDRATLVKMNERIQAMPDEFAEADWKQLIHHGAGCLKQLEKGAADAESK